MDSNIPRRDHQRRQARQRKPHNHHHKARPYESRHDCRSSDSIRFGSLQFNSVPAKSIQYEPVLQPTKEPTRVPAQHKEQQQQKTEMEDAVPDMRTKRSGHKGNTARAQHERSRKEEEKGKTNVHRAKRKKNREGQDVWAIFCL